MGASKFFFRKWWERRKNNNRFVSGGCSLEECAASRKQERIKQNTERSLLKKVLVSRNERRELENIDERDPDLLITIFFLLQVRKNDGE